jgi:hypothetical protein
MRDSASLVSGLHRSSTSLVSWPASSRFSTYFVPSLSGFGCWLASCFDLLFAFSDFAWSVYVFSDFWVLSVNFLVGLINFRMLGAYVDSSATLIPALQVPLDFSVIKCTLVLHSGTSGSVILLIKGRCSADDISTLFGVLASAFVNPNGMTRNLNCPWGARQRGLFYLSPSLIRMRR